MNIKTRDFDPRMMRLFLTYRCFYECDHCMMYGSPTSSGVMPKEDISQYLELAHDKGIPFISFTGGEPFMEPDNLFYGLERSKELGLKAAVESSFIGKTEEEISENARRLGKLGVPYMTSIHPLQKRSCPPEVDFEENKALMLRELLRNGVGVDAIKVIYVPEHREIITMFRRIMCDGLNATYVELPGVYAYHVPPGEVDGNPHLIDIHFQKIMRIGRAYDKGLEGLETGGEMLCFHLDHSPDGQRWDEDQVLIHPNGLVHTCCQHQRGVDFGYGNLKIDSWEEVVENIETHPLLNPNFPHNLARMQTYIEDEHPELVPKDGFGSGCDVCNLFHRKADLRHEMERELDIDSGIN
jgi:hypothetical protein